MSEAPPRGCAAPGCGALVRGAFYCARHRKAKARKYERARGSSTARGYGPRWRRYRLRFLAAHPWCVECKRLATVVDHIQDHRGNADLFWDPGNHQPMCAGCHNTKTARSSGGFWSPGK